MSRFRSFALTAHVDAGKTTLAEQLLYVTGRIHRAGEVRGDRPTQLDHRDVERRRGITVSAAATTLPWHDAVLSLVDTPGHVDFGVEVERAMAVLDGAVLVVCGVAGVQAQTRTVEQQMARHGVARLAFVNKCDHPAADPARAAASLRTQLGAHAALVQWPLGLGGDLGPIVDLVHGRVLTPTADGRDVTRGPVPAAAAAEVAAARERLVDAVSLVDEALVRELLETGEASPAGLSAAIRRATVARAFVPVLVGSAARCVGVPAVLDAVVDWLPAPGERPVPARAPDGSPRALGLAGPAVAFVFKTDDTAHGAWTWLRVWRGRVASGDVLVDGRGLRHRVGRLGRLHAGEVEPLSAAGAGEIVAAFGLDVASGETLCDPAEPLTVGAWRVPEPVVDRAITLVSGDPDTFSTALRRLVRDDPTLRLERDAGTGELRLRGMGELHLDVARDLLEERWPALRVALGLPTVALRHRLAGPAPFDHTLKKQNGGPGTYARLVGSFAPAPAFSFRWAVTGGAVPAAWARGVEAALRREVAEGAGTGWPLEGLEVVVTDGQVHSNDSSEHAFALCAVEALRGALAAVGWVALEPWARVVVEAPDTRPGVLAALLARRGAHLLDAVDTGAAARVEAKVPLARTFGFTSDLRSATRGAGTWTCELAGYA